MNNKMHQVFPSCVAMEHSGEEHMVSKEKIGDFTERLHSF